MNKLESLIVAELEAIDVDSRYSDMLDDIYPGCTIAGMSFNTSNALKELDPTAYRCGLADWISEEDFVEINNEYYDGDECDSVKDDLVSEIDSQIEAIEEEISGEESNDEPCQETISDLKARLAEAETEREKWDNYSF
jgi:hypothetical protein